MELEGTLLHSTINRSRAGRILRFENLVANDRKLMTGYDPESGTALSSSPRYFYAPIGTQKVHYISLSVPIKALCIKILAVGEGDTEWKFGDAFIPPMDSEFGS